MIVKDLLEPVLDPVAVVREIGGCCGRAGPCSPRRPMRSVGVWDDYTHRRPYTLTGYRRLFRDQGLVVQRSGYEPVMPGIGIVSTMTRGHRRPRPLGALARLRVVRRNVSVLARRPQAPTR